MSKAEADLRLAHELIRAMASSIGSTVVLLEACGASMTQDRMLLSRAQRLAPSNDPIVQALTQARQLQEVSR